MPDGGCAAAMIVASTSRKTHWCITQRRSKTTIGYTQSSGGTRTKKVLPELPLPNSGRECGRRARPSYTAGPLNLIGAWSVITAKRMTSTNRRTQNHVGCERVRLAGARTLRDTGGGEPSTPTWPPLSGRQRGQSGLWLGADPEPRAAGAKLPRQDDQGRATMRRESLRMARLQP